MCVCCVCPGHSASICEQCVSTSLGFWKILSKLGRMWRLWGEGGERLISGKGAVSEGLGLGPKSQLCYVGLVRELPVAR